MLEYDTLILFLVPGFLLQQLIPKSLYFFSGCTPKLGLQRRVTAQDLALDSGGAVLGIMEKKMKTTIACGGYIGIMEKKMETTIVCRGYIGIMEKKVEATIPRDPCM